MSRAKATEIARANLPSDCLTFRLDADPEPDEDDVLTWTGTFECLDGTKASFTFLDHWPDGFEIDW